MITQTHESWELFGDMKSAAIFSDDMIYRYSLTRVWNEEKPILCFLMLNPSKADAFRSDNTVSACLRRALAYDFGGLRILNCFAFRSTDPKGLLAVDDPVGPENDDFIRTARECGMVILGWGCHATLKNRNKRVLEILDECAVQYFCLKKTADNHPQHPLYLKSSLTPIRYKE